MSQGKSAHLENENFEPENSSQDFRARNFEPRISNKEYRARKLGRGKNSSVPKIGLINPALTREEVDLDSARRLCRATLARAIIDLTYSGATVASNEGAQLCVRKETHAWIMSPDTVPWSFVWLCQHIGLDNAYIVAELTKLGLLGDPSTWPDYRFGSALTAVGFV